MPRTAAPQIEASKISGRRLRRALMEAGVVLSLTLAIVAVLCMFGLQRASAFEINAMADSGGRLTMGAVLLGAFVALCGLTTYMLRDTMGASRRAVSSRQRRG
ncbi:hypothetical protein MKI84_05770 [Ancylobacter sp. A5.8]|uniref:hypothetical protein n=1 Tax=Ancylobacter gelatini TaxID=2919920 RepID=UPI001F4E1767|nr:hypothetical protein [Ancylobacter gelatini]MCJ8142417.1 hypothetical protein [Ancylobacter gelatini]